MLQTHNINLVSFKLDDETFETIPLPVDESKTELTFACNNVNLANLSDSLCLVSCMWQNVGQVLSCRGLSNGMWLHRFNVTLPNGFVRVTCSRLFHAPRCPELYVIHEDNSANMLIYKESEIGFRRFILHEPRRYGYSLFDLTPNIMQINDVINAAAVYVVMNHI